MVKNSELIHCHTSISIDFVFRRNCKTLHSCHIYSKTRRRIWMSFGTQCCNEQYPVAGPGRAKTRAGRVLALLGKRQIRGNVIVPTYIMIRVWQIESFVAEISLMQKVWGQSIQVGDKREPGQNMSLGTLCHHVIHIIAWFQALETGMDLWFIEDQIFTAQKLEGNRVTRKCWNLLSKGKLRPIWRYGDSESGIWAESGRA